MASPTKKTESIRAKKKQRQGSARKGKVRQNGTTLSKAELFGDDE